MNTSDAEILSEQLLRVAVALDESIGFVRERSTQEESEEYTKAIAKVLGHLYWHVTGPLWEKHPNLKPEDQGGPYKIDRSSFESCFPKNDGHE